MQYETARFKREECSLGNMEQPFSGIQEQVSLIKENGLKAEPAAEQHMPQATPLKKKVKKSKMEPDAVDEEGLKKRPRKKLSLKKRQRIQKKETQKHRTEWRHMEESKMAKIHKCRRNELLFSFGRGRRKCDEGGTPEPRAGRADRLLPPQAGSNSRSSSFPGDGLRVTSPLSLCGEPRRAQVLPVLPICTTVMLLSSLASPPVMPSAPSASTLPSTLEITIPSGVASLWHCYFGGRGLKSLIILNPRQVAHGIYIVRLCNF
nr:uncharacterized protein LOC117452823 [Pseudochaenichthys georgianus]